MFRIRQLENCVGKLQDQMAQLVGNLQSSYSQHESTDKKPENDEDSEEKEEEMQEWSTPAYLFSNNNHLII